MFKIFRGDSNLAAFFSKSLNVVMKKLYEKKYPEFKARKLIPINTEVAAGADSVTYYMFEGFGLAKIITNYAKLVRGDVAAKETLAKVKSLGLAYDYSIQDIRRAQLSGVDLPSMKGANVKKGFMMSEDHIAFLGDDEHGLHGLFTHPNITKMTLPADGTGSSTRLLDKTVELIIRDLNAIATKSIELTNGVEVANTILMTASLKAKLSAKFLTGTSVSVLDYFLDQSEHIESIETVEYCKEAGVGSTEIICSYRRDEDTLNLIIPQDFEQFEGQEKDLSISVPCHQRIGGTVIYYPLSVTIAEGVN